MYLSLLINGEQTEEYFCHKHGKWNWIGDECSCCLMEEEDALVQENYSQLVNVHDLEDNL